MKLDIRLVYLTEQALCISYQRQSRTFTISSVKRMESSMVSCIHLLDGLTFEILHTYRLEGMFELYGSSIVSCVFSNDDQEYVCVGTTV